MAIDLQQLFIAIAVNLIRQWLTLLQLQSPLNDTDHRQPVTSSQKNHESPAIHNLKSGLPQLLICLSLCLIIRIGPKTGQAQ